MRPAGEEGEGEDVEVVVEGHVDHGGRLPGRAVQGQHQPGDARAAVEDGRADAATKPERRNKIGSSIFLVNIFVCFVYLLVV